MQVAKSLLEAVPSPAGPALDPRRLRAHAQARRHSAQVRWLRRAIPFGAGAAGLAIVVGTWLNPFGELGVSVSLGSIGVSGSKVTMESPRLSGYRSKDNRPYVVTAKAALQDVRKPFVIELQNMLGRLTTDESGGLAHIEATAGIFDTQKEALDLSQHIRLWTDKGQEARLTSAHVDFKAGTMSSREAVTVTMPTGSIKADGLDVTENGKTISFVGNVKAVFSSHDPSQDSSEQDPRLRTTEAQIKDD
ncbi:lipopolysaccharide-assembly, LptC-related protein [Methylobacterium variabile]|jgi:lipopolysaccharide export system protein LptC|uniref:Lipopolysaccharide-assembly, LptC-related protein n=1 Tax=Methylobacterium variabile TaxID=298794 RepID=A0A0J6TBV2_9HYPH|nr:lipopolysaccharide-assembly, LptC-related protein [Methylobacterium variabile]